MTATWTDSGVRIPLTVLSIDSARVVGVKSSEKNGYCALQIGSGWKANARTRLSRAELGQFAASSVPPSKKVVEFRVQADEGLLPLGTVLGADWFKEGQTVDVRGTSKGKGFAGVMKRWGFHGGPASHGSSLFHRKAGSTGQNQTPGRVLPGKKMAGRMGGKSATVQSATVIKVDPELNIVMVRGQVPGPNESYVRISDAIMGKQQHID